MRACGQGSASVSPGIQLCPQPPETETQDWAKGLWLWAPSQLSSQFCKEATGLQLSYYCKHPVELSGGSIADVSGLGPGLAPVGLMTD